MAEEASRDQLDRAKHDRAAFARLYDLYVNRIYGFALVHTSSREEAEDVTAQTFERALAHIAGYEDRGAPFSAWLIRIASNLVMDRARRRGRATVLGDDALPEFDPRGNAADHGPPAVVERWERATWLLGHVEELPTDQQQAVELRFWGERSYAEIGEQMGRSEAAVKQLVYRALRAMRAQMEREASGNA
jgi:RNA polymerase sigma-70 factor (ECF subfamily)